MDFPRNRHHDSAVRHSTGW
ncbi:MAG: hypothetical protein ABTR07_08710 [Candidatus Competibacter denitrificans]